jgi:hypothetical protein
MARKIPTKKESTKKKSTKKGSTKKGSTKKGSTKKKSTKKKSTKKKSTKKKSTKKKSRAIGGKLDAGQVAMSGFAMQVLFAVLDGLTSEDWVSLTVEPHDEDGSRNFEKVDIRWVLSDGRERHDQVKTSRRSFGMADMEWWAEQLSTTSDASTKRLVLVGAVSTGVQDTMQCNGVEIRIIPRGEYMVRGAISHQLARFCEHQGLQLEPSRTPEICKKLLGLLLLESVTGKTWTKEQFIEGILELVRAEDRYPEHKELMAQLLKSLFSKEGLLEFMAHVEATLPSGEAVVAGLRQFPEPSVFFKAADSLDARGVLRESQFYILLRHEFPGRAFDIEFIASKSGASSLDTPRASFLAQSLPRLIERRPWAYVRDYLTGMRGLLPIEFIMGTRYSYIGNVAILGEVIDQLAIRVDSGGPRCCLYYLRDPDRSLFRDGVETAELHALLGLIKVHVVCIRQRLDRGHPLFGLIDGWDAEVLGAMRDFGCRWFHIVVIGGRRDALCDADKEARSKLIEEWPTGKYGRLEIMTYDRLWTAEEPIRNDF